MSTTAPAAAKAVPALGVPTAPPSPDDVEALLRRLRLPHTRREYDETWRRQTEIRRGLVPIPQTRDAAHLQAIHRALFANVYDWAGQFRTVNMEKGGRAFLDYRHLDQWLGEVCQQIRAVGWANLVHGQFAEAAAAAFANINYAHGFREGNGRSSRIFLQHCVSGGRFELDFTVLHQQAERWNEASRLSVPRHYGGLPDPAPLQGIFREISVSPDPAGAEVDGP